MKTPLFDPNKFGFKLPLSNAVFNKKFGNKHVSESNSNPCDRDKLIAGLKKAQEKNTISRKS